MIILHDNNWTTFRTQTLITNDGFGMISIDYYKERPDTAFIHDFSVIPPARKKGVGKMLLQAAMTQIKERGCKVAELNYNSVSTPMWVFDWYERNGFKEVEFGRENHLMRKLL